MPNQEEIQSQIRTYSEIIRNIFLKRGLWQVSTSLYLIGGFARGEGVADFNQGRLRIYNDLDFLVIVKRKNLKTLLAFHRLLSHLKAVFDFCIDFVILEESEVLNPEPKILNFDIQRDHRWVWGEKILESKAYPTLETKDISLPDTLQLLLNRQASLLIGLSLLENEDESEQSYLQVQMSKPLSAMLIALQALEKTYTSSYQEQLQWMRRHLEQKKSDPLWEPLFDPQFFSLFDQFESFQKNPHAEHFKPFGTHLNVLAKGYHAFIRAFMEKIYQLPKGVSLKETIDSFYSSQPKQLGLTSLNGWILNIRSGGRVKPQFKFCVHPQVDVYMSHLLWMNEYLLNANEKGQSPSWRDSLSWYNQPSIKNDLSLLIDVWKISGYGCRLQ